jgi:hypothetical protein
MGSPQCNINKVSHEIPSEDALMSMSHRWDSDVRTILRRGGV